MISEFIIWGGRITRAAKGVLVIISLVLVLNIRYGIEPCSISILYTLYLKYSFCDLRPLVQLSNKNVTNIYKLSLMGAISYRRWKTLCSNIYLLSACRKPTIACIAYIYPVRRNYYINLSIDNVSPFREWVQMKLLVFWWYYKEHSIWQDYWHEAVTTQNLQSNSLDT